MKKFVCVWATKKVQVHVPFLTVALLGAKFCLGACTDIFLLCREERGLWYLTNPVCFCWSRAPCVVWVLRKVLYCLLPKVNAEKQETASVKFVALNQASVQVFYILTLLVFCTSCFRCETHYDAPYRPVFSNFKIWWDWLVWIFFPKSHLIHYFLCLYCLF